LNPWQLPQLPGSFYLLSKYFNFNRRDIAVDTQDDFDWQSDLKEIQEFLTLQPNVVKQNCSIVSSENAQQKFMLRIDKFTPDVFIPNMPKSAMPSENTNTPRITVAPTLIGCMIGYFRIERDVQDGTHPDAHGHLKFAGGYTINKLDYRHCLLPNENMVGDAKSSQEHWLVPYSIDSVEYEPNVIGQIFVSSVTYLPNSGHWPGVRIEMYLKLEKEDEIQLLPGRKVKPGHYRYTVYWPNVRLRSVEDVNSLVSVEAIDATTYNEVKKAKADMLSFKDRLPGFVGWK
jgi:hypothetical protein